MHVCGIVSLRTGMFPVGFHFERLLAVSATDCTFHGKRRAEATPREVWHHSRGAEHCCVVYLKHGTYRCKAKPAREQPVFRLVHYHRHATRVDDLVLEESIGHRRVLSLIGRRHYKERPGSADPPMHNLLPLYRPARKAFRGGQNSLRCIFRPPPPDAHFSSSGDPPRHGGQALRRLFFSGSRFRYCRVCRVLEIARSRLFVWFRFWLRSRASVVCTSTYGLFRWNLRGVCRAAGYGGSSLVFSFPGGT